MSICPKFEAGSPQRTCCITRWRVTHLLIPSNNRYITPDHHISSDTVYFLLKLTPTLQEEEN